MRILIDPGDPSCRNVGDVAMLQVALERLGALWPAAEFFVITSDADALAQHCPGSHPVADAARRTWLAEQLVLGRFHGRLPLPVRGGLAWLTRCLRHAWPGLLEARIRIRAGAESSQVRDLTEFLAALRGADLVVTAGQGTLNETFWAHARIVLDTMDAAIRLGKATAMLGQGIGPFESPAFVDRAGRVLRRVALIGLRDRRLGPRLVEAMGVDPGRIRITGDDAVEMAYAGRSNRTGTSLGLNLRIGRRTGIDRSRIERFRGALYGFAERRGVPIVALPIALGPIDGDPETIGLVVGSRASVDSRESFPETPRGIVARVAGCRVVVAAAYHAAVFALSQGVPAICLARSGYYWEKFLGLRDLFGEGCRLISLDEPGSPERLGDVLEETWTIADSLRDTLLEAAWSQVRSGREAYGQLHELISGRQRAA